MALRIKTPKATTATLMTWAQFFQKGVVEPLKNYLTNHRHAWYQWMASLAADVAKEAQPAVTEAEFILKEFGAPIKEALAAAFAEFTRAAFISVTSGIEGQTDVRPEDWSKNASDAMADAFGFGLASFSTTAAFEMLLPEKLNTLNGVGPMLATLAGFKEVSQSALGPVFMAAIERPGTYAANAKTRSALPTQMDATMMAARRLIGDADADTLIGYAGMARQWVDAIKMNAYRSVQPRALATAYVDIPFPRAQVQAMMEFGGYRDADIGTLLDAFEFASVKNVRQQYLSAVLLAAERGTLSDAEVESDLTDLQFSDTAKHWVKLTIATRRLEQLTELYRHSVSEMYAYDQITDAQYVPALEAIGIGEADANAHYAIDSAKRHGKEAAAAARAAARLAAAVTRAAVQDALARFRDGTLDYAALLAALVVAGLPTEIAAFAADAAVARLAGSQKLVFGLLLDAKAAQLLREQVATIKEQVIKKLIPITTAFDQLRGLNIPGKNLEALASEWAAQAKIGTLSAT